MSHNEETGTSAYETVLIVFIITGRMCMLGGF